MSTGTWPQKRWLVAVLVLAVVVSAAAGGLAGSLITRNALAAQPAGQPGVSAVHTVVTTAAEQSGPTNYVTEVYKAVAAGVVSVNTQSIAMGFWGPQTEEGAGSGFVIDKQGHILTNYHVVQGASKISVTFSNGTSVKATVTGTDPGDDLALLKVNVPADQLVPLPLGDSDQVQIGEPAIAVGNPYGLSGTVTLGIISGRNREMTASNGRTMRDMLQTDAAINPGNSGGPLLNAAGQVIGINTAIISGANEGNIGIGFAIPINTAKKFLPDLLQSQQVQHPWLGITGVAITPELQQQAHLPVSKGVLVVSVWQNGPADQAGIKGGTPTADGSTPVDGDIITAVDGHAVTSVEDIASYLDTRKVGDVVQVYVLRGGHAITISVTLGAWPDTLGNQ